MKKILVLLALIILTCCACVKNTENTDDDLLRIKKNDVLVVGVRTDTKPFGYYDNNGKLAGFDIDLAHIMAKNILDDENKVKFVSVNASNRIMKLYSNEVDMLIATMSVTPKRKEILDFSDSYYVAGQTLLVKADSKIRSLSDMSGKTAIIVFGSTAEMSLKTAVPGVKVVGYKDYKSAYHALKAGKGDAIISDNTILGEIAKTDSSLKLLKKKYTKEPYSIAFRKGKESENLIKFVNVVINQQARSHKLKELHKKYDL